MEEGKPSRTAIVAAYYRAHHFEHDDPRIFADAYAGRLLTDGERDALASRQIQSLAAVAPETRAIDRATALRRALRDLSPAAHVIARARYTEDRLTEAIARGVAQYVIVGAGLDTFAFRRADLGDRLQVFEVDHPATQAMKRRRLAAAGLVPPPNLHFVAADLERESVGAALGRAPFVRDRPALFAWLGVTMYLTREAIFTTLAALPGTAARGSELVFDYVEAIALEPDRLSPATRERLARARRAGEPIVSGLDPATLPAELSAVGLRLLEDIGPAVQQARYFHGRTDGLHARAHSHVACATWDG
jgi:methyltransferase (TIGR00027 family)